MASSLNSVILMGRLAADPTIRHTQDGTAVANFDIAVTRKGKNEDSDADFFTVVCWRQTAEFADKYFHKGENVVVRGVLQNRRYVDKLGQKRKVAEIVAEEIYFAGGRKPAQTEAEAKEPIRSESNLFADDFSIGEFGEIPNF